MISLIFVCKYSHSLLRFDVEADDPIDSMIKMGAHGIYDHKTELWVKFRLHGMCADDDVGDVVGPPVDEIVAVPHHTFFHRRGLYWHVMTDDRLSFIERSRARRLAQGILDTLGIPWSYGLANVIANSGRLQGAQERFDPADDERYTRLV